MGSNVISFRVPEDLYKVLEQKCRDEGMSPAVKLWEFVDSVYHPTNLDTDHGAQVKVINVEGEKVDKVTATDSKKKSWFPLDFSPLFGKD